MLWLLTSKNGDQRIIFCYQFVGCRLYMLNTLELEELLMSKILRELSHNTKSVLKCIETSKLYSHQVWSLSFAFYCETIIVWTHFSSLIFIGRVYPCLSSWKECGSDDVK